MQDGLIGSPVNRFRPAYRELTAQEKEVIDTIKLQAWALETLFNVAPSREASIAITKLEEAVMWAVKAITK